MLADHGNRIGVLIWRRPGKQVKHAGRQRVLVGASIDVLTHQLLGRSVGDRSNGEIGCRESARVSQGPCYSEVREKYASLTVVIGLAEQDVGGLDISVQQATLVGVIECAG